MRPIDLNLLICFGFFVVTFDMYLAIEFLQGELKFRKISKVGKGRIFSSEDVNRGRCKNKYVLHKRKIFLAHLTRWFFWFLLLFFFLCEKKKKKIKIFNKQTQHT